MGATKRGSPPMKQMISGPFGLRVDNKLLSVAIDGNWEVYVRSGQVTVYGRYGIRRWGKSTTFNLRYDHRLGNLWLRGTWGRASPRGSLSPHGRADVLSWKPVKVPRMPFHSAAFSRDRGCPTYGMMLGFTQSIYKRVSLKSVGSIVVDRDSLLVGTAYVQPNLRTIKCQHTLVIAVSYPFS